VFEPLHPTDVRGVGDRFRWRATCEEAAEQFSGYLEGELVSFARRRVARHLRGCAGCRSLLASLARTIERLRALRGTEPDGSTSIAAVVIERINREHCE
jgi:predicted anti-sigma-YlaC factor YlaD